MGGAPRSAAGANSKSSVITRDPSPLGYYYSPALNWPEMNESGTEWLSLIGPLERLGHGAVEVVDKSQHLSAQVINGAEVAAPQELADQDAEPDFHLVHPRGVFGRVVEDNRMRRISQEGCSRHFRPQDAAHVFDPKVLGDPVSLGNVAHETLRAVDVEIVSYKVPLRRGWITRDGAPHVSDKIGLSARRPMRRAQHLSRGHIEVDHERQRALALVLKLPSRHFARSWREVRRQPLQGLDVRQLIGAHGALACLGTFGSGAIHSTHVSDLGVSVDVCGRGKPIPHSVRLKVGRFLTSVPRGAERCGR